ncbi:MAG: hydantoinase B/oxoprolinase family protein [Burkholderiaceae bacterium]
MKIDPADLNIIGTTLSSIAAEMGDVIQRAAYSTIVREARDYSTCITDAQGRMVAQSELIAVHMNSLAAAMDHARRKYDFSTLVPGEALITNNPYENGQHLNDVIIVLPVFHEERLAAFVGVICHHLELGGSVAGSNVHATELYHEGLILPTMRVGLKRDLQGGPIEQILSANVRIPQIVIGDFRAQVSALERGEVLVQALLHRHGMALVEAAMAQWQDYAEQLMRSVIRSIPDGDYRGEDTFDGRGLDDPLVTVRARVTIAGDDAIVDLSESDDQVTWPVNAPIASTHSAVLTLFGALLGPGFPTNDGTYRPVRIVTRKGSVVDPHHPAPVRGRMTSIYRVFTAVKRALGTAIPERLSAAGNDSANLVTFSVRGDDGYRMFTETVAGGNGASQHDDGAEAVAQALTNTANTPIEEIEMNYPFIRILSYGLLPDSGGAGARRGGLGIRREYEVLRDGTLLSTNGDRHCSRPWGLAGGGEARPSSLAVWRDGVEMPIPAASNTSLRRGDRVVLTLSGGGGYGDPKQRGRDQVRADLRSGRISREAARSLYGLED